MAGAKFKYCLDGSEPVIKDLKAVNDSYYDGEVLKAGAAEAGGLASIGIGTAASIIGVCNQDGTLPAASGYSEAGSTMGGGCPAVLAGTQAAGTIENLKVIVNPGAVYSIEYDQDTLQTYDSVADTVIDIADGVATTGHPNCGGGWVWSYNTGELDYCVSSALNAGNTEYTVVTGTDTTSTSGIVLYPSRSGISYPVELNAGALKIAAGEADVGIAGTNAVTGIVLENRIESLTYGSEILDPVVHNQQKRYMASNTSYKDKAKVFAYVRFNHVLAG